MKKYYGSIISIQVDLAAQDHPQTTVDTSTHEFESDDVDALQKEEERFFRSVMWGIEEDIEMGGELDPDCDLLHVDVIYDDSARTHEIARFEVSVNELTRYVLSEQNGVDVVFRGDRFNTRTASRIGEWIDENRWTDVYRVRERLYRKRNGRFFLEESTQRSVYRPMWEETTFRFVKVEDAQQWVKDHAPKEYDELFGKIKLSDATTTIVAHVRVDTKSKIDRLKSMSNESVGQLVDRLVAKEYDRVFEKDE